MAALKRKRVCELAWLVPRREGERLVVGETADQSSERSLEVETSEELLRQVRRISQEVWEEFGLRVSISLEGLADPTLLVTLVGDRWHFWYINDGEGVSLRSTGDKAAKGRTRVLFSDFDQVPNSELVPGPLGERVLREWFEHKRPSDAIEWREG